jgi:hypothetical protein
VEIYKDNTDSIRSSFNIDFRERLLNLKTNGGRGEGKIEARAQKQKRPLARAFCGHRLGDAFVCT